MWKSSTQNGRLTRPANSFLVLILGPGAEVALDVAGIRVLLPLPLIQRPLLAVGLENRLEIGGLEKKKEGLKIR